MRDGRHRDRHGIDAHPADRRRAGHAARAVLRGDLARRGQAWCPRCPRARRRPSRRAAARDAGPRWPTPMTAIAISAIRHVRLRADDGDARFVGRRDRRHRRRASASCPRRPTAPSRRRRASPGSSRTPTTGTSNRMSCFGFATLMMRTPGPARCPARPITSSVPSIASTATTAWCLTAMVCPMSSPAIDVRHPVAELEILLLVLGRRALGQHAGPGQQRREQRRRVDQLDAVIAQHVGDGANQAVGVPRGELASAPRRTSGRA